MREEEEEEKESSRGRPREKKPFGFLDHTPLSHPQGEKKPSRGPSFSSSHPDTTRSVFFLFFVLSPSWFNVWALGPLQSSVCPWDTDAREQKKVAYEPTNKNMSWRRPMFLSQGVHMDCDMNRSNLEPCPSSGSCRGVLDQFGVLDLGLPAQRR